MSAGSDAWAQAAEQYKASNSASPASSPASSGAPSRTPSAAHPEDWRLWKLPGELSPSEMLGGTESGQGLVPYLGQVASGFGNVVLGTAKMAGQAMESMGNPAKAADFGRELLQPNVEQAQKAGEAWQQGRRSEAFGHGLAAALPVVGPPAANIGEKLGEGDYTGAAADATVLGGTMAAPHVIPPIYRAATRLDPAVAAERAWRPTPADSEFPAVSPAAGSDIKTYGNPSVTSNAETIPAANRAIEHLQMGLDSYLHRAERAGVQIPGDVLVRATYQALPDLLWTQDPATAQALVYEAQRAFGGKYFDVARWRDWLKTENASLSKFYAQAGARQSAAGTAGTPPGIEAAQTAAMREALYQYLSPEDAGAGPREIQARTGDVINLRNHADRASNRVTGEHALTPLEGTGKFLTGVTRMVGAPFQHGDLPGAFRQAAHPQIGPTDSLIGRFYDALPQGKPIPQPASPQHPYGVTGTANRQLPAPNALPLPGAQASYVSTSGLSPGAQTNVWQGINAPRQLPPGTAPFTQGTTTINPSAMRAPGVSGRLLEAPPPGPQIPTSGRTFYVGPEGASEAGPMTSSGPLTAPRPPSFGQRGYAPPDTSAVQVQSGGSGGLGGPHPTAESIATQIGKQIWQMLGGPGASP